MGMGSSGGPDLSGNHQHTDCVLNVICSPMVSHDQLWRLFDIVPNMDYCKMNKDFELSSSATVVYSNPQSALHARYKATISNNIVNYECLIECFILDKNFMVLNIHRVRDLL